MLVSEDGMKTQDLPPRRKTSGKLTQAKCRVILKKINSLTYLVTDNEKLVELEAQLQKVFLETEKMVKSDKGIVLETSNDQNSGKKRKCRAVPKKERKRSRQSNTSESLPERKYGKPRHPYSKRVGARAGMMKKDYKVNVPIPQASPNGLAKDVKGSAGEPHRVAKKNVVDLTQPEESRGGATLGQEDLWVPALGLKKQEKQILENNQAWLNDVIINTCHNLLRKQFPHLNGLESPLRLAARRCTLFPLTTHCIQIHHSANSHWVVSTVTNGQITVYDSMLPFLSSQVANQLLHMYGNQNDGHKPIRVTVTMCQTQVGESDCGVFAIAFALAAGVPLENVMFDQPQMRPHLYHCLQTEILAMFPHRTVEKRAVVSKTFIISK